MSDNKLERTTIVDQVFLSLRKRIVKGEFQEGTKLPSEANLASYYDVNRLSIRMAIQKLNILGLTETRDGKGTFVKEFKVNSILKDIGVFYDGVVSADDVQQLRYVIEMGCARLALKGMKQQELKKLKDILDFNNNQCIEYNKDNSNITALNNYIESDINLHKQIVAMSGNKMIIDLYDLIASMVQSTIRAMVIRRFQKAKQLNLDIDTLNNLNETHNMIYHCLATGDQETLDLFYQKMLGLIPMTIDEME